MLSPDGLLNLQYSAPSTYPTVILSLTHWMQNSAALRSQSSELSKRMFSSPLFFTMIFTPFGQMNLLLSSFKSYISEARFSYLNSHFFLPELVYGTSLRAAMSVLSPFSSKKSKEIFKASAESVSSESRKAIYFPLAAVIPLFLAAAEPPCGCVIIVANVFLLAKSFAISSDPSSLPSLTRITSIEFLSMLCPSTEARHLGRVLSEL